MVPYLVRSACDMLSKLVGTQLTTFRTASRLRTAMHFHGVQRQLLTYVGAAGNYMAELAAHMARATAGNGVGAGAALWIEGRCEAHRQACRRRLMWSASSNGWTQSPAWTCTPTRQLAADLPWAADLADTASGLLAIRISDVRQRYVLWFRPQIVRTVQWAGEAVP